MDEMREREKRETLAWDGLCGCDGFIEIDGGWVGRKAPVGGGWAGAKGEKTRGGADGLGRDLSFSLGCQATPMQRSCGCRCR